VTGVFCNQCGHRNAEGSNFCSSCGAALEATREEVAVAVPPEEGLDTADAELAAHAEGLPPGVGILVVRRGPSAGSSYLLDGDLIRAGRHPDSQIFLNDITVSRRHAEFVRVDQGYLVRDVGSLNGTYVNRQRTDAARLAHGDEVQIGKFRLVFLLGTAAG